MRGEPGAQQQTALDQAGQPVEVQRTGNVGRLRPRGAVAEPGIGNEALGVVALSGQPAFGEWCLFPSRNMITSARLGRPFLAKIAAAISSNPLIGAGAKLRKSSKRAAAQPKLRYRGLRCPIMLSSVFAILYAKRPGRPSTRYQKAGATTPSLKFSARLSMAARAAPWASRLVGSRPTMCRTAARPAAKPPASNALATVATWS